MGYGDSYQQLGRVAQEQRRFEQAQDYYQQAVSLLLEFDDRDGAGRAAPAGRAGPAAA